MKETQDLSYGWFPSDAIYKQTLKALSNRESLYRQILDRASCGKVKILQKTDSFHPQDVEKSFMCDVIDASISRS